MTNYVDLNSISLADLFNGLATLIKNAIDAEISAKLPAVVSAGVEKPLTTEELGEFINMSEPVVRQMAEEGIIPRHKFKGVRGYRFFASEVVAALRGQQSLS